MSCIKCGQPQEALSPEGECFPCSTGDGECKITAVNMRESMGNVAKDLGHKLNMTGSSMGRRMVAAVKGDKAN